MEESHVQPSRRPPPRRELELPHKVVGNRDPDPPTTAVRLVELWGHVPKEARETVLATLTRMVRQALPGREVRHD
jgi:hypothetical protein